VTEISSRPIRPQNPKPPFNYVVKEVFVENTDASITLAGTLTLPSDMGKFPAVVLITGSGPQDRDQTFMGHKTFWVLADYLTQKGIAVLRLDDRGVGQSTGNFPTATSVDFAQDISFAVDFLLTHKNINNRRIGLIGHSEGGLIAPITAQMNENVAFIAMLAGPGKTGHDIAVTQIKTILMANGVSETAAMAGSSITESLNQTVINNADPSLLEDELLDTYKRVWVGLTQDAKNELLALGGGKLSEARIAQLSSSWTKYFLAHNPADFLNKLTIPILALHGSKDTQMEADENLRLIKRAFSINQNRSSRVQKIAGVNHLFQNAGTGGMNEYAQITETMSPKVLKIIAAWVLETSK
jgi:pimeloyl-ACP methyl ester carboxylesterase